MGEGRGRPAVLIVLLLLPVLPWLFVVPRAGQVQYNDYWGIVASLVEGHGFVADPVRWLTVKSNEHTVAVPAAIYAANVKATGGDNRPLSALAVAAMAGTALLAWFLVPAILTREAGTGPALALAAGTLCLTPVAAHNVVYGFSGTMWLLANLLALAAVAAAWKGVRERRIGWLVAAAAGGLAASLTYSTGIAVWLALGVLLLAAKAPWRWYLVPAVPALADLAFEVITYTRPASLPPPETANVPLLGAYVAVYLGHVLVRPLAAAAAAGALGVVTVGILVWRVVRGGISRTVAPWLAIGAYALANAVATAVGRAGIGGARSSRYATLASLFWLAVLVVAAAAGWRREAAAYRRRWPAVAVAILVAMTWIRGSVELRRYLEQAAVQPLGALAWVEGIRDDRALGTVCLDPAQLWKVRDRMIALGHVPFDRPSPPAAGTRLEPVGPCRETLPVSHLPVERTLGNGLAVVEGPADRRARAARTMVLVDGDGAVTGWLVPLGTLPWRGGRVAGYAAAGASGELGVLEERERGTWCRAAAAVITARTGGGGSGAACPPGASRPRAPRWGPGGTPRPGGRGSPARRR